MLVPGAVFLGSIQDNIQFHALAQIPRTSDRVRRTSVQTQALRLHYEASREAV